LMRVVGRVLTTGGWPERDAWQPTDDCAIVLPMT
jgi:hypothetical protein